MMERSDVELAVQEEARHLAQQLFGNDIKKCATFTDRLLDTYARAKGKDLLLIHNPGGWGSTRLENCLQWERSIVEGVNATMEGLGYTCLVSQYFRSGSSRWVHLGDAKEEARYFVRGESSRARVMAAELRFMAQHISELKVILIGASQGAAFSNIVLQCSNGLDHVYSIEVGLPFYYASRRVITKQTLAIDSNGLRPDDMVRGNLIGGFRAYVIGPLKWLRYRLQGRPVSFAKCISAPGHDYNWEYPKVRQQIEDFLTANFGRNNKLGGGVS